MQTDKTLNTNHQPEPNLAELDQALVYLAAAVANLHEAARHLTNYNLKPLTEHIVQAREEIRKSWRGLQQVRNIAG